MRFSKKALVIILIFVVLAGLDIYQYLSGQQALADFQEQSRQNQAMITAQRTAISSLNSELSTWEKQAADYGTKAQYYEVICDFLTSKDAGYASNNFKASKSIIVLSQSADR